MAKERLTIDMKTAKGILTTLTQKQYNDLWEKSIPIFENYDCYFRLSRSLEENAPDFDHAQLYAGLKTLYGESSPGYDDFKCSFEYHFLLKVIKKDKKSKYIFRFYDLKGGTNFYFRKVIEDRKELEKYDRDVLHKPFEEEFSEDEMCFVMEFFVFFLVGFMKSYKPHYKEEFFRSNSYHNAVYGYVDGIFFADYYEDEENFHGAIEELKKRNIPYNRVTPYPQQNGKG